MAKQKKPVHRVEMTEGKGTSSASFSKNTISRPQKISRIDLLHFRPLIRKTYQNGGMSMYPRTIIDSLSAVPNRDQLTHKDLHAHFSTGQSILLSGSGRDKKYGYRNGIQTDLGDIRNDVWLDLVRELIVRSHEEDLFDKLLEWEKEHTYWLKTKAELEHYTLELYAARIFDNPKWVDYEAFAKHYGYQPQSYEG